MKDIRHIAKRYAKQSDVPQEDLENEGVIGLLRATEDFDPYRGVKFSAYASRWITQTMRKAVIKQGRAVSLPNWIIKLRVAVKKKKTNHFRKHATIPTNLQLLESGEISQTTYQTLINLSRVEQCENVALADATEATEGSVVLKRLQDLDVQLNKLDPTSRAVLSSLYGLRGQPVRSVQQISESYGKPKAWCHQIKKQAIERLQERMY